MKVPLSAPFVCSLWDRVYLGLFLQVHFLVKGKCTGDKDAGNYTVKGRICLARVYWLNWVPVPILQRQNTSCQANVTSFGGETRKDATKCIGILWAQNFSSHRRVAAIGWCSRLWSNLKLRSLFFYDLEPLSLKDRTLQRSFKPFPSSTTSMRSKI